MEIPITKNLATHVVHWVTGPVHCCKSHAEKLVYISRLCGQKAIPVTGSDGKHTCLNCVYDSEQKETESEDRTCPEC